MGVHLLSTRFYYPDGKHHHNCCEPKQAARLVVGVLEKMPNTRAFDPNIDNAFIMQGVEKEANSIWLLNWRWALKLAKEKGGKVWQVLVHEPSNMQRAEEDMANDKGVPVVKIDLTRFNGQLHTESRILYHEEAKEVQDFLHKHLPAVA